MRSSESMLAEARTEIITHYLTKIHYPHNSAVLYMCNEMSFRWIEHLRLNHSTETRKSVCRFKCIPSCTTVCCFWSLLLYCTSSFIFIQSKETYGQTHGLSNLEMKRVGKVAIIGRYLKAVKTSCVHTMQGHTYLIKRRLFVSFCCTHFTK